MAGYSDTEFRAHVLARRMRDALKDIDRYESQPAYFRGMRLQDLYDSPDITEATKASDLPPGIKVKPSQQAFVHQPGYKVAYERYINLINEAGGSDSPVVRKAFELKKEINRPAFLQQFFNLARYGVLATDDQMIEKHKRINLPMPEEPVANVSRLELYEAPSEVASQDAGAEDVLPANDAAAKEDLPAQIPQNVLDRFPQDVQALSLAEAKHELEELLRGHRETQAGFDEEVKSANGQMIGERKFWSAEKRKADPPGPHTPMQHFTTHELLAPGEVLETIVSPLSDYDRARYYLARNEELHRIERYQIEIRRESEHRDFMRRQDHLVEWIQELEKYHPEELDLDDGQTNEYEVIEIDLTDDAEPEPDADENQVAAPIAEQPANSTSFSQVWSAVSGAVASLASKVASAASSFKAWVGSYFGRGDVTSTEDLDQDVLIQPAENLDDTPLPIHASLSAASGENGNASSSEDAPNQGSALPDTAQPGLMPWSQPHSQDVSQGAIQDERQGEQSPAFGGELAGIHAGSGLSEQHAQAARLAVADDALPTRLNVP